MFHAFIWLSEKIQRISGRKTNVQIQSFYFFTEINVIVITQRVKYQKKVPLTEFQVPIPVPYWFKCEWYPTLLRDRELSDSTTNILIFAPKMNFEDEDESYGFGKRASN